MSVAGRATAPQHTRDDHMAALRADFESQAGRSLALPIAGALVWSIVVVAGLSMPERVATLVLLFGSGAIFPLGLLVAHPLGLVHAVLRTMLVTAAWWLLPDHRVEAVALAVVIAYASSILALAARPRRARPTPT